MPKSLITGILNGVCNEETVNFKDDGLFMMPPLFTCPISDKHYRMIIVSLLFVRATLKFKEVPANLSNAEDTVFNSLAGTLLTMQALKRKTLQCFSYVEQVSMSGRSPTSH